MVDPLAIVSMKRVGPTLSSSLCRTHSRSFAPALIHKQALTSLIGLKNADRGTAGESFKSLLTFPQCLLGVRRSGGMPADAVCGPPQQGQEQRNLSQRSQRGSELHVVEVCVLPQQ